MSEVSLRRLRIKKHCPPIIFYIPNFEDVSPSCCLTVPNQQYTHYNKRSDIYSILGHFPNPTPNKKKLYLKKISYFF